MSIHCRSKNNSKQFYYIYITSCSEYTKSHYTIIKIKLDSQNLRLHFPLTENLVIINSKEKKN